MKAKRNKVTNNATNGANESNQYDNNAPTNGIANEKKLSISPELAETGETEIEESTTTQPAVAKTDIPQRTVEQFKLPPDKFAEVQNEIEAAKSQERQQIVYANSIESHVGYDSLLRLLSEYFGRQIAYFRSEQGGALSLEAAREAAYSRKYDEAEASVQLNQLLSVPSDKIKFEQLWMLHQNSAPMAENLWELIKRQAQREFESGHRAGAVFEPADYMTDAWNRASYLGLRESLCKEWQPKGGIELTMIDAVAQAWLQLQFWTKESVLRSRTKAREVDYKLQNQKKMDNERNKNRPPNELWDIPLVSEQSAVEHAAQMADRWQRMYFRAIRNLRDWRRYTPQVTINNPNQVNIANNGGQQINVSDSNDETNKEKNIT
jgi:hypothetical protein